MFMCGCTFPDACAHVCAHEWKMLSGAVHIHMHTQVYTHTCTCPHTHTQFTCINELEFLNKDVGVEAGQLIKCKHMEHSMNSSGGLQSQGAKQCEFKVRVSTELILV